MLIRIYTLILSSILICFSALPASSFTVETRKTMIDDAIFFCPPSLQTFLSDNRGAVKEAMFFLDRNYRRDVKLDSHQFEAWFLSLISSLEKNSQKNYDAGTKFGLIACFISETVNPHKLQNYYRDRIPQASEETKIIKYDGHDKATDIKIKIDDLIATYNFYHTLNPVIDQAIIDLAYSVAVNEIVDYWVSAWIMSGNEVAQFCSTGKEINHAKQEKSTSAGSTWQYDASGSSGSSGSSSGSQSYNRGGSSSGLPSGRSWRRPWIGF